MINGTSTYTYDDVAEWHDNCIAWGNDCHRVPAFAASMDGNLTYVGMPWAAPTYWDGTGPVLNLLNRYIDGKKTIEGNNHVIYYMCDDWDGAYASKNVS